MGALTDAVTEAQTNAQKYCTVGILRNGMTKTDRAELDQHLASELPHSVLSRALTSIGHKIAGQTVSRHRQGQCCCPK